MKYLKKIIARNFEAFTFYFRYLRYKIFILVLLSVFVGVLDGFGLTMFLPLLQMVNETTQVDAESLGKMGFLVELIESSGISLNLLSILLFMAMFFLLKGGFKFINGAYKTILRQYFISKLRNELLKNFNRIQYKYYVTADVGRIQNTMSGEVERVSRSFLDYFSASEQAILVMVYVCFAFFVDARFALLVTVGGWLSNFLYKILYKHTKGASKEFTKDSHIYQGQIIQHVANFKYLKATGLLKSYAKKLENTILDIEKNRKKIGILNAILEAGREPMLIIIVACVILIQTQVFNAPLGPILISLLFFYRALAALVGMQNKWNRFLAVSGSLHNMVDFQDELKMNKEHVGKKLVNGFENSLSLKQASFSYGEVNILKDINLTIRKNETVAFVGESGSGKTTLLNVLSGLIQINDGEMHIDSILSEEINFLSYQRRIGYITQDPVIFNDTIFNNVTFWAESNKGNKDRFNTAVQKAAITGFIGPLANGANTLLGSNGANLSGGQKQRISIARELYKDIDILIMDEATSALDSETERSIQQSIEALKGQYTILIVAHRLSTIKNADRIVVMKNGRIESVGNYTELFNQDINFKKMVELQEL